MLLHERPSLYWLYRYNLNWFVSASVGKGVRMCCVSFETAIVPRGKFVVHEVMAAVPPSRLFNSAISCVSSSAGWLV